MAIEYQLLMQSHTVCTSCYLRKSQPAFPLTSFLPSSLPSSLPSRPSPSPLPFSTTSNSIGLSSKQKPLTHQPPRPTPLLHQLSNQPSSIRNLTPPHPDIHPSSTPYHIRETAVSSTHPLHFPAREYSKSYRIRTASQPPRHALEPSWAPARDLYVTGIQSELLPTPRSVVYNAAAFPAAEAAWVADAA